jgi:TRAP-type C4-dicarboxylate transport system permease small subunit
VKHLAKFLTHIGSFIFAVILLLASVSVFFRYVLNDSIVWAEEVMRYTFFWMFFLCTPEATRTGMHICLDVIPSHAQGKVKVFVDILIEVINNIFLFIVLFHGIRLSLINMIQTSPALRIPYGFIFFALPTGATLMILFSVHRIYRILTKKTAEE